MGFLRDRYWLSGCSISEIAAQLGCSPSVVRTALHRHGIDVRRVGAPRIDQLYDARWLRATAGMTVPEIAILLECSEATVRWAYRRSGIAPGPVVPLRPERPDDVDILVLKRSG